MNERLAKSIASAAAAALALTIGTASWAHPSHADSGTQLSDLKSIADSEPGGAIYNPFAVSIETSAAKAKQASLTARAQKSVAEDVPGLVPTAVAALVAAGIFLVLLRLG